MLDISKLKKDLSKIIYNNKPIKVLFKNHLTKAKKADTKGLYNSINFRVVTDAKGFTVQFFMKDYGTFVDKGVSGTKKQRSCF